MKNIVRLSHDDIKHALVVYLSTKNLQPVSQSNWVYEASSNAPFPTVDIEVEKIEKED